MATATIWCGTQRHRYQYFGRTCCLYCHSTLFTSQIMKVTTVRNLNLKDGHSIWKEWKASRNSIFFFYFMVIAD